jgi:hypothetical protein
MSPFAVVKHLDVVSDIFSGIIFGFVLCKKYPFGFQTAKETLCHGIVPAVSFATHATDNAMGLEYILKVTTAILTATI